MKVQGGSYRSEFGKGGDCTKRSALEPRKSVFGTYKSGGNFTQDSAKVGFGKCKVR